MFFIMNLLIRLLISLAHGIGFDRLSPGGHFVNHGHVQITVQHYGKGSRYGGGRHNKNMNGTAFFR